MHSSLPVIVVGAGHAGVEAADAAARMGCDVVLITLDPNALVRLSCNPAIGGIGKGHLVREIDALGGVMGEAADLAGIHFRVLNGSRGRAVQGPRVQQDYYRYPQAVRERLLRTGRVQLCEDQVTGLAVDRGRLVGVQTKTGRQIECASAVVTSGTFLRGRMYCGDRVDEGGRVGEVAANDLSGSLAGLGLRIGRFKTGTPPRLVAKSIEFSRFEPQPGDIEPVPLSFANLEAHFRPALPQTITYLAKTTPDVHRVVRANLDRSPLYSGRIESLGPRYCPSFEDKVVKFSARESHLLHLEPMGLDHPWIYVNGLSTSLPEDAQAELVAAIPGLESAEIARFGYAVEYDYVPPTQLSGGLEYEAVSGLFFAGQICGTTGYEEAAALGLVAGINAARRAQSREVWVPQRRDSYLGVMTNDLTVTGVLEPYRMFTARAELRLSLSCDNADRRMASVGMELGLIDSNRVTRTRTRWARIESALQAIESSRIAGTASTLADEIRRGTSATLPASAAELPVYDRDTLLALIRYDGYLQRELREAGRHETQQSVRIPEEFCFESIPGLSHEVRQRLHETRPRSLGDAARVPGVGPAALAVLAAALKTRRRAS